MQILKKGILCGFALIMLASSARASEVERDLEGKTILVNAMKPFPETPGTGMGDILQGISYIKWFQKRGADVVFNVPVKHPGWKGLRRYLKNRGDIKVDPGNAKFDQTFELADLYVEHGRIDEFKSNDIIFRADRKRVEEIKKTLRLITGNGKIMPIAVSYACAKDHEPHRSLEPSMKSIC